MTDTFKQLDKALTKMASILQRPVDVVKKAFLDGLIQPEREDKIINGWRPTSWDASIIKRLQAVVDNVNDNS